MGKKVLLSDLVDEVREAADMEYGGPVSDAEIKRRLLRAVQKLYDKLISARGQDYYRSTAELDVTPGQALYSLPADFYKLLCLMGNANPVMANTSSAFDTTSDSGEATGWTLLRPFEMLELPRLLGVPGALASDTRYRLRGKQETSGTTEATTGAEQLELRPTPTAAWTLRLEYLPVAYVTEAGNGDLLIDGISGFEDWAILQVAIYCARKEETDTTDLRAAFALEDQRISEMASARDHSSPERIVDACGLLDGSGDPLAPRPWAGGWLS